jgi:hypothetical protein
MDKLLRFKVVLPVLVVELELRASLFLESPLGGIEFCDGLETMRTVVIRAFMDGHFLLDFPAEKSQTAVRTEQLRFPAVPEPVLDLKEMTADLAFDL